MYNQRAQVHFFVLLPSLPQLVSIGFSSLLPGSLCFHAGVSHVRHIFLALPCAVPRFGAIGKLLLLTPLCLH